MQGIVLGSVKDTAEEAAGRRHACRSMTGVNEESALVIPRRAELFGWGSQGKLGLAR